MLIEVLLGRVQADPIGGGVLGGCRWGGRCRSSASRLRGFASGRERKAAPAAVELSPEDE
jgi:hypothetical protein